MSDSPSRPILLVEDDSQTTQVMARLMRLRGFAVVIARSLAEARACLARENIGFLVSDIGLPDGSGCDLMTELRSVGIQGVAISGFGMEADVTRSREAGFTLHLVKPIQIADLDRVLDLAQRELAKLSDCGPP